MVHKALAISILAVACVPFVKGAAVDLAKLSKYVATQIYISRQAKRVREPDPAVDPVYVALGSSFAAGPGVGEPVRNAIGFMQGTLAYPQLLASKLLLSPSQFVDAASSGALLSDVAATQLVHLGPNTKLVTLTAGGNDVGYTRDTALAALLCSLNSAWIRHWAELWFKPLNPSDKRPFRKLHAQFDTVLQEIRRRAPDAVIVVVTYGTILPPKGALSPLGVRETTVLRNVALRLRHVTVSAARRNNAIIVDWATASAANYAGSDVPWATGFSETVSIHPNERGHSVAADDIYATLLEMNYIPTGRESPVSDEN